MVFFQQGITCTQVFTVHHMTKNYDSHSVYSSPVVGTGVGEVNVSVGEGVKMRVGDE